MTLGTGTITSSALVINGGEGSDIFNININSGSDIPTTDLIAGGGATNTLNGPNLTNAWTIIGTNAGTLTPSGGGTISFSNITNIAGGSGTDTVTGNSGSQTWSMTGSNAFTNSSIDFTAIENITIGSGLNTFNFADGAAITGTLTLTDGTAALDYTNGGGGGYSTAITVDLVTTSNTTGVGSITIPSNVRDITGSSSAYGTIVGINGTAFAVSGTNSGTFNTYPYSNINKLTTSSGASTNTVTFTNSATLNTLTLNGSNTLDYTNSGSGQITLNLLASSVTAVTTLVNEENITTFIGTSGLSGVAGNFLIGGDGSATFTMDSTTNDKGTYLLAPTNLSFENVSNLTGGTGPDTFIIYPNSVLTGKIEAGADNDVLNYTNFSTEINVDFTNNSATNIYVNSPSVIGGTGGISGFHEAAVGSHGTITGGANGLVVIGKNGVQQDWTVDGSRFGNVVFETGTTYFSSTGSLTLQGGNAVDTFTITGTGFADVLNGGSGTNTLTYGIAANNTWNITENNSGNINGNVTFSNMQNITCGPLNDYVNVYNQKGISGLLDGSGGINTLDYSRYTTPVSVTLPNGPATNMGAIANFQFFIGPTILHPTLIITNGIISNGFYEHTVDENYNITWYPQGFSYVYDNGYIREIYQIYIDEILKEENDFEFYE